MMLSSTDLPQTLAKVRQLGIGWYVVKPVKRAELYAAIAGAMAARGSALNAPNRFAARARSGRQNVSLQRIRCGFCSPTIPPTIAC